MKPALVVLALLATGCAATSQLLAPRLPGPDQEVVVSLVCRGHEAMAIRVPRGAGRQPGGTSRTNRARTEAMRARR